MNPGRKRIPGLDDPTRRPQLRGDLWRRAIGTLRSPSHWLFAGVVSTISWGLLNSGAAIENIRTTPQKARQAVQDFKAWFYDDAYWTGVWGNNSEYMLGAPKLSETDIRLSLVSDGGHVGGMISTPWTCMWDIVAGLANVEGEIDVWGRLQGSAWDFRDNKKIVLFTFTVHKDDLEQGTVRIRQGALAQALPADARLIRQIEANDEGPIDAFDMPPRCVEEHTKTRQHWKANTDRVEINRLSSPGEREAK